MEYSFEMLKDFFGDVVIRDQNDTILLDGRPCEIEQMMDGLAVGRYTDTDGTFYAMSRFDHVEVSDNFDTCDGAMGLHERETFDRATAMREFVEAHSFGESYSILDYWHWYRRLSCACYPGRMEFFDNMGLEMERLETPEWFLNLIYHHAPEPFNDCGGIFKELLAEYGMEATE